MKTNYLETIKNPADLKRLSEAELDALTEEIRDEIVDTVAQNGGHLASNKSAGPHEA